MENPKLLLWALPFVLVASLLEAIVLTYQARKNAAAERYDWRAMGASMLDQVGRFAMRLVPISLAAPFFAFAQQHRLLTIPLDTVWAAVVLFVGQEFFYYWYHRAAHRVRWFWANHSVHHSPNQLNLSAAYRLGWFGKISGVALFFTPLVWLGFDSTTVLVVLTVNLLYQFWIHATWIPKLGFLEGIVNTPSAHRVHHACNLRYLDANYGGVLVIFDRLFGTYIAESSDEPCVYGWVKPMTSHNPIKIELTQWAALVRDVLSAGSIADAVRYLIKPPGWRPHGPGETTDELRARAGVWPVSTDTPERLQTL